MKPNLVEQLGTFLMMFDWNLQYYTKWYNTNMVISLVMRELLEVTFIIETLQILQKVHDSNVWYCLALLDIALTMIDRWSD